MRLWYNLIWILGIFVGMPFLIMTLVQPKRRATFLFRLGWCNDQPSIAERYRPIWIHALSVGEVISAEPIVDQVRRRFPSQPLVFSTSTYTGMQTAQRLYADKVRSLFYYPYDLVFSVEHVVRCVNPKQVVIVETDIWPNFLFSLQKRDVPVYLVNARLSTGSFRGYRLLGGFIRKVLSVFTGIGAQSEADAARFIRLGAGAEKVLVTGNIKFDQLTDHTASPSARDVRLALGIDAGRKVLLLGSTHPGEETEGLAVFVRVKERFRDALLIVAPRNPMRAETIAKQARSHGLSVRLLASMDDDAARQGCDVLVVSVIGLLRRLYAIAHIAFVGGSLVRQGGHNPLEPAVCAKPILFGPDMRDFSVIADQLIQAEAAVCVRDSHEWYRACVLLLADPALCERMGRQALSVFESNKGAVENTLRMIGSTRSKNRGAFGVSDQSD